MEVQAALWGVRMAQRLSIPCLHLEGDSEITVHCIMKGEATSWKINKIIKIIKIELKKFQSYRVTHVLRKGNNIADILSKAAISLQDICGEVVWEDFRDVELDDK